MLSLNTHLHGIDRDQWQRALEDEDEWHANIPQLGSRRPKKRPGYLREITKMQRMRGYVHMKYTQARRVIEYHPRKSLDFAINAKGFNLSRQSTDPAAVADLISQYPCRGHFRTHRARCSGRSRPVDWRQGSRSSICRSITAACAGLLL